MRELLIMLKTVVSILENASLSNLVGTGSETQVVDFVLITKSVKSDWLIREKATKDWPGAAGPEEVIF